MPSEKNEKVEELIRTAEARIETGRYAEADAALIEAANLQGDHARLWYTFGVSREKAGRRDDAIGKYETACKYDPTLYEAWSAAARALMAEERWERARKAAQKALELRPSDIEARYRAVIARLHFDKNDFDKDAKAIEDYYQILEEKPDAADAYSGGYAVLHRLLAYDLWAAGDTEAALDQYCAALKLDPDDADACQAVGELLFNKDQWSEAASYFSRVAELWPEDAASIYNCGLALLRARNEDAALLRFQEALKIDPNDFHSNYQSGRIFLRRGEYQRAVDCYQQAARITKVNEYNFLKIEGRWVVCRFAPDVTANEVSVHNEWGLALSALGRTAEAVEQYRIAAELQPDDPHAYLNWAEAEAKLGDAAAAAEKYRKAAKLYEKAAASTPQDARTYSGWGVALSHLGDFTAACEQLSRAADLVPDDPEMYNAWGSVLQRWGHAKEAAERFARAAELEPNHPYADFNCGLALTARRSYAEAAEHFKRAAERTPEGLRAATYHAWGVALCGQRRYSAAIGLFQKAVELDSGDADARLDWGSALAEQGRYRQAIDITRPILRFEPHQSYLRHKAYARHNIADFFWRQGEYAAARAERENARKAYHEARETARRERNADFFALYGAMLHEEFSDPEEAADVLMEGLEIDPNHPEIHTLLATIYTAQGRDRHPRRGEDWAARYWEAGHHFERAEEEWLRQEAINGSLDRQLGELFLTREVYDSASLHFEKAREADCADAAIHNNLGVICTQMGDNRGAAKHYQDALRLSPRDLGVWSNFAETYLRLDQLDRAEQEYRKILTIAPEHIDSKIGLAEVYTAMAEGGDAELFDEALRHYDEAVALVDSEKGSKQLSPKERAALLYARGYAAVKAYEAQGALGRESLLTKALHDFRACVRYDPENYKAARASEKIRERRKAFGPDWFARKVAPWLILLPAISVLVLAQFAHFYPRERGAIGAGEYGALTFGAMMFIIVGLFLPQIQKLKGAGIELEKTPMNQITIVAALNIRKQSRPPAMARAWSRGQQFGTLNGLAFDGAPKLPKLPEQPEVSGEMTLSRTL